MMRLRRFDRNSGEYYGQVLLHPDGRLQMEASPEGEHAMRRLMEEQGAGEPPAAFLERMARRYGWGSVLDDTDDPAENRPPRDTEVGRLTLRRAVPPRE